VLQIAIKNGSGSSAFEYLNKRGDGGMGDWLRKHSYSQFGRGGRRGPFQAKEKQWRHVIKSYSTSAVHIITESHDMLTRTY
jgi:hypothetical protein